MKSFLITVKQLFGIALLLSLSATLAHAQDPKIPIEQLDKLAKVAEETVEVTLDERLIKLAIKFLPKDPTYNKVREVVAGLKGIYVRVYTFDKPGEYDQHEVEQLRNQLHAPAWRKAVGVRSRRGGDNVDVHLFMQGDDIAGLAIIAANPKELTLVNIIGMIDLEKLSQLQGQLGIPKFDIDFGSKSKPRDE